MKERTLINVLYGIIVVLLLSQAYLLSLYLGNLRREHAPVMSKMGERVISGDAALTVEALREDQTGEPPFTPLPGDHFEIAEFTLENLGTTTLDVIPLANFHLKDKFGYVYSVVAVPSDKDMLSGPLQPGDTLREEIGFEVRNGAEGLRFYYESGRRKDGMIIVDLGRSLI